MSQATAIPTDRKLFTREGVEASLVYVMRVLLDIVELHDDVVATRRKIERVELGLGDDNPAVLQDQYTASMDRLRELVAELDLVGVELIDFEVGIVLFPTVTSKGDGVYAWSLRRGGEPILTRPELARDVLTPEHDTPPLKGGVDA